LSPSGTTSALAARVGSWDVYSPSRLADVLAAWSSADPFLIVAPLRLYEYATDSFVADTLGLRTNIRPIVNYSDVHGAVEYKPSPLRTLYASFYVGVHGLSGGRQAERSALLGNPPQQGAFSASDEYDWRNALGQIRYATVIGRRTLATAQIYGSSFRMKHAFDLVDNLNLPVFAEALDYPVAYDDIGLPVRDENRMNEVGAGLSLDHSRGNHQLVGGLEGTLRSSAIRIRAHSISLEDLAETTSIRDAIRVDPERSSSDVSSGMMAAWVEDRFQIGRRLNIIGGLRTTYVGRRKTAYAEPRLSAAFDTESPSGRRFSGRVAGGLYRQFVTQLDLSALNAGSLLPSVRIWLPNDGSVRPSSAWHLAASASFSPTPGWTFTSNAFGRYFEDVWAYNYTSSGFAVDARRQADFLAPVEGRTLGADIEIARTANYVAVSVQYGYVLTERSSPELFDGRVVSSPGLDPHHLRAEITATPIRPVTLRVTWRSGWDRRWAYTRAYYDYFGHDESLRLHAGFDFGRPDDHSLPPTHQLDVGAAVSQAVGPVVLQLRADVTNVLRRDNVASYRLIHDGQTLVPAARPLMPRLATFSAQLSWRRGRK
jgi:hypothetical protein